MVINSEAFPLNDHKYSVKEFMSTLGGRSSGVLTLTNDNLKVVPKGGMTITVKAGDAFLSAGNRETVCAWIEEDTDITLDAADYTYDRIDYVIFSWDVANLSRVPVIKVVSGAYSSDSSPATAPTLEELKENNDAFIVLASISVNGGAIDITDNDITDTRADSDLCGVSIDSAFYDWTKENYESKQDTIDIINSEWHSSRLRTDIDTQMKSPSSGRVVLDNTDNKHLEVGDMVIFNYTGNSVASVYAPTVNASTGVIQSEIYVGIMRDHCGVANAGNILFDVGKEIPYAKLVYDAGDTNNSSSTEAVLNFNPRSFFNEKLLLIRIR